MCVYTEKDVCRSKSKSGELADQYDVDETACDSGP